MRRTICHVEVCEVHGSIGLFVVFKVRYVFVLTNIRHMVKPYE